MTATPYLAIDYPADSDLAKNGFSQLQGLVEDFDALWGAETTWTPTVTQSGTLTMTNTYSKYRRLGSLVKATLMQTYSSGTGTAGQPIKVTLPVNSRVVGPAALGWGYVLDASVQRYNGLWVVEPGVNNRMVLMLAGGQAGVATMTAAVTTSDRLSAKILYEV